MHLSLESLIYVIPAIFLALSMHEFAHGYVSTRLGDPTPGAQGRLSLNPMNHLDPIGTLCLLLFGFGWAKPVAVNPYYYDDRKKGMVMVALAGPLMNFILAFVSLFALGLLWRFGGSFLFNPVGDYLLSLCSAVASINIGLGVFNLIPFPPLDGSKILSAVLPSDQYFRLMTYESYGQILLFALLWLGFLDGPLYFLRSIVTDGMMSVVTMLLGLG